MAGTSTVDPRTTNPILIGLEGDEIWSTTELTYAFATAADASRTTDEFTDRGHAGTINYLDTTDPDDLKQRQQVIESFNAISRVVQLNFSATADFDASDFNIVGVDGFTGLAGESTFPGDNLLPFSLFDYESWNFFDTSSAVTNSTTFAREQGGTDFMMSVTLHELLHGIGLGHPHDTGHGSSVIAQNLTPISTTDNVLDNERYTVMSYEAGGLNSNTGNRFGHAATPMALDIAILQKLYGANTSTHTGNTTYNLTDRASTNYDANGNDGSVTIGRTFYSIWDNGGTDSIKYGGAQRTVINLNAATLDQTGDADINAMLEQVKMSAIYGDLPAEFKLELAGDATNAASAYYAGGFFSRVFQNSGTQDLGGYSIANGVVIENAEGGANGDLLIGNSADNTLDGKAGNDGLFGFDGNDTLKGGADDDELTGGDGDDRLEGGAGTDVAMFTESCRNYEISRDDATGVVTIRHVEGSTEDGTDTLIDVETARFADGDIDLTADEIDDCPPLDFTFLVDLSGSFGDDLPNFVASAKQIAVDLRADNPDVKFAIASFVDLPVSPYGSSGDYLYKAELELTDDATAFEAKLDSLRVFNGGDFPEAQWVGLWRAANGIGLNLREGSSRVIYMATDATAHDAADYGLDESTILDFLETEGVDVTSRTVAGERPVSVGEDPDGEGAGVLPILPPAPGDDPLVGAVGDAFRDLRAIPIIGTSGSEEHYRAALADIGSGGVVVTTSRDSSDVADAVRAGLAAIGGSVTELGTDASEVLTGTENRDVILGLGGDDTITGLGDDDDLDGSAGNDEIDGGAGHDNISGGSGNDLLLGGDGDDTLNPGSGLDTMTGGAGADLFDGPANSLNGDLIMDISAEDAILLRTARFFGDPTLIYDAFSDTSRLGIDLVDDGFDFETFELFFQGDITGLGGDVRTHGSDIGIGVLDLTGTAGADILDGNRLNNILDGLDGDDKLLGNLGNDTLLGGLGNDTLNGGDGDDSINGGPEFGDLRDVIFAGAGNDTINAAGGNDLVYGQDGNDQIAGGFGTDELRGQDGDDVITGSALSDLVFGGAGNDFVNGGWGHDRINGGSGADKFYHLGIFDHGSDWVQDYTAAEGDVLLFGNVSASRDDFQVNFAHTASPEGERSGDDDVQEAFVIYRPTGQIMWALVDGAGQDEINLKIGGNTFDLLA